MCVWDVGGGVILSLKGYKCAAGTLITHLIYVKQNCQNIYLFIYSVSTVHPIHVNYRESGLIIS